MVFSIASSVRSMSDYTLFVPLEFIDPEIIEVLDAIHRQALLAKPVT